MHVLPGTTDSEGVCVAQRDQGACPAGTVDSEGVCVAER